MANVVATATTQFNVEDHQDGFNVHGPGVSAGVVSDNIPAMWLKSGTVVVKAYDNGDVEATYSNFKLFGARSGDRFSYGLRIFAGRKAFEGSSGGSAVKILTKDVDFTPGGAPWSQVNQSGSVTVDIKRTPSTNTSDAGYIDSQGYVHLFICIQTSDDNNWSFTGSGCGCSGLQRGLVLELIQGSVITSRPKLLITGKPDKPSITASSPVLVGKTFSVSCSASDFNYTTNNGTSYSSNTAVRSFTIPSDHSIYNYKFRARNRDYRYVSEWSDYVEATVSAKLNIPSSPTFNTNPVLYGNDVSVVTPSYPTPVEWNFLWSDSVTTKTRSNVITTGLTCRIRVSKNNFISSDYSSSSGVLEVKLNSPSDLSYAPKPVILNDSVTLSCSKNNNPSDSTVMYEYGEASTYNNVTSWVTLLGDEIDHISSNQFWVRSKVVDSSGDFIDSDYCILGSAIQVKLPKPEIIDQFTSITILNTLNLSFTYDSQLSPLNKNAVFVLFGFKDKTLSEVVKSVNPNKNYFKVIKNGEQSETADGFISIFKVLDGAVFKLQLSKSGYVDSDLSESSNEVVVYYEPNKMIDHGFTYKFLSENLEIAESQLVLPGQSVSSNWSSYSSVRSGQNDPGPDNGLMFGRFSRYRLELQKKVSNSEYKVVSQVSGSNDPSRSGNSSAITINPSYSYNGETIVVAGSICRLALTCYYNSEGPVEESPIFYSPEFQIAGYPNKPEMIYPSIESGKSFTTCNLRPKIVFKVSNSEYLPDAQIYDIRVEVVEGTRIVTYTFKNNPEYFLLSKSLTDEGHIQNETYVSFILTESTLNRTVRVWSSNAYMENDLPVTVTSNYQDLKYPIKGDKISQTQINVMYDSLVDVINTGYSKLKNDSGAVIRPYNSYSKYPVILLETVKDLTESLLKIYQELLKYTSKRSTDFTGRPEFVDSLIITEIINQENPQYVNGNYFNNIVYILKMML